MRAGSIYSGQQEGPLVQFCENIVGGISFPVDGVCPLGGCVCVAKANCQK